MSETSAANATENLSSRYDLLLRAASAALLVAATIISAALTVYYGNEAEFPFEIRALFFPMFIFGFLLFLVLCLAQFPFKKTLYFCIANYLVFCIGVCLYFQSAWFLWDLGPLMAGEFWWDWEEHGTNTIIEFGFYIALITILIWGRKWLYNNLIKLSFVIIAIEAIALFPMLLKPKEDFSYRHYTVDNSKKYEFGKDKNIIICVLDCFSTPLMEELLKQSPEIKDIFSDFTMYPKYFSEKTCTSLAVPAIMTGANLDKYNDELLSQYYNNEKKSILLQLKRIGFRTDVYPCELWADGQMGFYYNNNLMSNLIPHKDNKTVDGINPRIIQKFIYTVCLRISPLRIKSVISRNCCVFYNRFFTSHTNEQLLDKTKLPDNAKFYQELKERVYKGMEPCVFKYYHLKGVHINFDTDENLNPLMEIQSSTSSLTRENYLKMAKGCIKLMEELILQLKNIGVYDNSVIIFMGDHGRMEEVMGLKGEIPGEHNPLLLVKMFHEKHLQMNINTNILLQTDICQLPLWSDPDSVANNYVWGSAFNSKQKDERLSVWKLYQNKEPEHYFKQSGKFELDHRTIDFSKKITLDIKNPKVEDSNLSGVIWLHEKYNEHISLLLANDVSVYSVPIHTNEFIYYCCDVSNVMDGEYKMYYMMEFDTGKKLIQFPYCKIIVQNKKPVVADIEEE